MSLARRRRTRTDASGPATRVNAWHSRCLKSGNIRRGDAGDPDGVDRTYACARSEAFLNSGDTVLSQRESQKVSG